MPPESNSMGRLEHTVSTHFPYNSTRKGAEHTNKRTWKKGHIDTTTPVYTRTHGHDSIHPNSDLDATEQGVHSPTVPVCDTSQWTVPYEKSISVLLLWPMRLCVPRSDYGA